MFLNTTIVGEAELELRSFEGPLKLGMCPATVLPAASADAEESSEYARWSFFVPSVRLADPPGERERARLIVNEL